LTATFQALFFDMSEGYRRGHQPKLPYSLGIRRVAHLDLQTTIATLPFAGIRQRHDLSIHLAMAAFLVD